MNKKLMRFYSSKKQPQSQSVISISMNGYYKQNSNIQHRNLSQNNMQRKSSTQKQQQQNLMQQIRQYPTLDTDIENINNQNTTNTFQDQIQNQQQNSQQFINSQIFIEQNNEKYKPQLYEQNKQILNKQPLFNISQNKSQNNCINNCQCMINNCQTCSQLHQKISKLEQELNLSKMQLYNMESEQQQQQNEQKDYEDIVEETIILKFGHEQRNFFPKIKLEQFKKVIKVFKSNLDHQIIVKHQHIKDDISYYNLKTLIPTNWLNDAFNTQKDIVYVPINQNKNHWVFVEINCPEKTITYYDSFNKQLSQVQKYLTPFQLLINKMQEDQQIEQQKFELKVGQHSQQQNGCDCGMFMLKGIHYLLMQKNNKITFDQSDIKFFRYLVCHELIQGKIETQNNKI
ncbi:hypothetical protein PPERSA_05604 [Pseudocohnilembus persalinus]|uniref:Ubiquitin-like protease family profile domain-containing protein n=1 Tax=Pseudocohnilembus persalinus TaxID=266149 RepID=A0A0V0QE61_PSEPJ|nr:hypothetical protein PPERSA_05604 [Pseudocohnilembus persalinus]|eukprot:KRX00427.1 hypothetical protein PPERSA_05604 [Pseudocohnilembus persalinus]